MQGNTKDSKLKETRAHVDELEKNVFALNKRVLELETQLEEREVDVRALTKKLRNQEEADTHYRGVLENFTKQAKEQYKKYENYLDNAEDLLNYALQYLGCMTDATHGALESMLMESKVELGGYFEYENKAETENNVRAVLDRFSRSQFLTKKKLFVDIKKRMGLRAGLRLQELEEKCEKLMEESRTQKPVKSISIVTDDNLRDEAFETGYYKLIEHMNRFREMLADGLYPNFSAAALSELLASVNALSKELYKYLNRFKTSMGGPETAEARPEVFNADIDALRKTLDGLEKLEYSKLIELRDKNNKLQIIQNHIKNLSKENEELESKITNNEFNLLVHNEIIMAYEKSIREKEEEMRRKGEQLEKARGSGDTMNQRVAKLTMDLIGGLSRYRERAEPVPLDRERRAHKRGNASARTRASQTVTA